VTPPPFVGLTGGIGAGKSEALAALERLGAATISADQVVHDLYDDPEVRAAVVARWGDEVAPDGRVDRAAVARHAFATDDDRRWLELLIWPKVAERVAQWRAIESQKGPRALVVETPLLFEAGMHAMYDATIAIVADEQVRAQRAAARGHEALDERTARQFSQAQKAERATYAVENSGTLRQLEQELSEVLAKLTS
jgi:dephospho-CoA kinase